MDDAPARDPQRSDPTDPAAHRLVADLQQAQQREDVEAFLALFRTDATWVTGGGRRLIGLDEIAAFTRQVLPGAMARSTSTYEVVTQVAIRPDVIAVGVVQRPVALDGTPLTGEPEGRPTYVIAEEEGRWLIVAAQNTVVAG